MQFGVRGITFSQLMALLSIIPATFLTGCSTASFADRTHADDVPANYRRQIADFMRTQRADALGLLPLVIHQGETVEISDPNKKPIGDGIWVCVRFGGATVRAYGFVDRQLQKWTGNITSSPQGGVLTERLVCGANPNFKPFPEAQPTRQPRT